MYFIGIDPGKKGAIALVKRSIENVQLVYSQHLPLHTVWGQQIIDLKRIESMIFDYCVTEPVILIEQVTSYGQGNLSAFRFGANSLGLVNYLVSTGLEVKSVRPTEWKRAAGLSSDKGKSLALAKQLFPQAKGSIISHDIAEAIILAWLCSTTHKEKI